MKVQNKLVLSDASITKITNEIDPELTQLFFRVVNAHNSDSYPDELCDLMTENNIDIGTFSHRIQETPCLIVDVGSLTFRVDGDAVTMEKTI